MSQVGIKASEQAIQNSSFDHTYGLLQVETMGFDGVGMGVQTSKNVALKVTVSGSVTYVGVAAPGTAQSSALWQCKKIDETTGTVITWADGNASFDNVATDLTALTYS